MKHLKHLPFWIILLFPLLLQAQKAEKIKGNHQVITRLYPVQAFKKLDAGDDLKITLKKTPDTTKIQLRADENLQDVLEWSVRDSILKLWLNKKIISKKKFEITLFVPQNFEGYTLRQNAQVSAEDKLEFPVFFIVLHDHARSEIPLFIKDTLGIELFEYGRLNGDWEAEKASVRLHQNGQMKGTVFARLLSIEGEKNGEAKLEGSVKKLHLHLQNKSGFNGSKLGVTKEAGVVLSDKTEARIYGRNARSLRMELSGSASLNIKGAFKQYLLEKFEGNTEITHKD